jgi:hypothetical protein
VNWNKGCCAPSSPPPLKLGVPRFPCSWIVGHHAVGGYSRCCIAVRTAETAAGLPLSFTKDGIIEKVSLGLTGRLLYTLQKSAPVHVMACGGVILSGSWECVSAPPWMLRAVPFARPWPNIPRRTSLVSSW